jgi:hypothetical protein
LVSNPTENEGCNNKKNSIIYEIFKISSKNYFIKVLITIFKKREKRFIFIL